MTNCQLSTAADACAALGDGCCPAAKERILDKQRSDQSTVKFFPFQRLHIAEVCVARY